MDDEPVGPPEGAFSREKEVDCGVGDAAHPVEEPTSAPKEDDAVPPQRLNPHVQLDDESDPTRAVAVGAVGAVAGSVAGIWLSSGVLTWGLAGGVLALVAGLAVTRSGRRWVSDHRDELTRDALVAGTVGLILLLYATDLDDRRAARQDVQAAALAEAALIASNVEFLRSTAMNPDVPVLPFTGLNLKGAKLSGLDFSCRRGNSEVACANFEGANLSDADLSVADLTQADLEGVIAPRADFTMTELRYAQLIRANLEGADLGYANMRSALLYEADLRGADLKAADLREALLGPEFIGWEPPVEDLHLYPGADLTGASLAWADLRVSATLEFGADATGESEATVWPV